MRRVVRREKVRGGRLDCERAQNSFLCVLQLSTTMPPKSVFSRERERGIGKREREEEENFRIT